MMAWVYYPSDGSIFSAITDSILRIIQHQCRQVSSFPRPTVSPALDLRPQDPVLSRQITLRGGSFWSTVPVI